MREFIYELSAMKNIVNSRMNSYKWVHVWKLLNQTACLNSLVWNQWGFSYKCFSNGNYYSSTVIMTHYCGQLTASPASTVLLLGGNRLMQGCCSRQAVAHLRVGRMWRAFQHHWCWDQPGLLVSKWRKLLNNQVDRLSKGSTLRTQWCQNPAIRSSEGFQAGEGR